MRGSKTNLKVILVCKGFIVCLFSMGCRTKIETSYLFEYQFEYGSLSEHVLFFEKEIIKPCKTFLLYLSLVKKCL